MSTTLHEEIYKHIISQSPDAVLYSDRDGIIRLWNQGAERIFGFSSQEAIGQSLDLIIPERLRERHWEGYFKVMQTGESRYGTELLSVPALHRDGRQFSSAFSIVMIKDDQGKPLGVASIMRDASAAFEREKVMKKRIAELEAQLPNLK